MSSVTCELTVLTCVGWRVIVQTCTWAHPQTSNRHPQTQHTTRHPQTSNTARDILHRLAANERKRHPAGDNRRQSQTSCAGVPLPRAGHCALDLCLKIPLRRTVCAVQLNERMGWELAGTIRSLHAGKGTTASGTPEETTRTLGTSWGNQRWEYHRPAQ